jgi:hypothetical protein
MAAFTAGIVAHLVQNAAYLGPTLFGEELRMLLANRVWGYPTKDEMKRFYQSVGLIHHGASPVRVSAVLAQLVEGVRFPGAKLVLVTTALLAVFYAVHGSWRPWRWVSGRALLIPVRIARDAAGLFFGRLGLWAVLASVLPLCLFPAFAQEVSLHGNGTNLFFFAVAATAVVLHAVKALTSHLPLLSLRDMLSWEAVARATAWALLAIAVVALVRGNVKVQAAGLKDVVAAARTDRYRALGDLRERFAGSVFMTNVSVTTVGFVLQERGWGVCGLAAVPESGAVDPRGCHSSYMRRAQPELTGRPRYFVFFWSPDLFPGFSDCLPSGYFPGEERGGNSCIATLYQRLSNRYEAVYRNALAIVFDLQAPPAASGT